MVPIAIQGNKKFDAEAFIKQVFNICKTHEQEKRALAFAFIVYDFEDHTIIKIIQDKHYWSSIDKLSGHYLSVFYVNSRDEYYKRRQIEINLDNLLKNTNMDKTMHYFIPLKIQGTPLDLTISALRNEFKIEENINHPFILFFQTKKEKIIDYFIVSLKENEVEKAFLEIKDHIRNAVEGMKEVSQENFGNRKEIFDLLRSEVKSGQFYKFIDKNIKPKASSILTIVKMLVGI